MIPKKIHFIWSGPPMSRFAKRCIESFQQRNKGWEIRVWDEAAVASLPTMGKIAVEALRSADLSFEVFADVAKPEIIFRNGGFYADCDIECIDPLDALNHHPVVLGCKAKGQHSIEQPTTNFFGFPPEHPYLQEVFEDYKENASTLLETPYHINRMIGAWRSAQIANPLPYVFNCSTFKTRFKSIFAGKVSCLIEKKRGEIFGLHFAKSTPKKGRGT